MLFAPFFIVNLQMLRCCTMFSLRSTISLLTSSAASAALLIATTFGGSAATVGGEVAESFIGSEFNWLMAPGLGNLDLDLGEPAALAEVAKLFNAQHPRASVALQNYLARYPKDVAAYDFAGVVMLQQGNFANAAQSFRRSLQGDPNNSWALAKYGVALLLSGATEKGEAELQRALESDPTNPLALRYLARIAAQAENYPEAVFYSERALSAFEMPRDKVNIAHFDLAELYKRTGRHQDILDLIGPAARNPSLDIPVDSKIELYGRYLDASMAAGEGAQAEEAMDLLLPLVDADNPNVQLSQARMMTLNGQPSSAIVMIRGLAASYPDIANLLRPDLAQALAASGKTDEAVNELIEAKAAQEPGPDIDFLREAVRLYADAGKIDKAMALMRAEVEVDPDRVDLQLFEVETLAKFGEADRARLAVDALLVASPDNPDGLFLQGTLAAAQGDTDIAVAAFERSLDLDPKQPTVWLTLAGTTHGHGSYTVAHSESGVSHDVVEALLRRAIDANPGHPDLHTELGLMYLSDGKPEDAIGEFDVAVLNSPGHIASLSLGALARADLGADLRRARAMMDRAMAAAPREPINMDIMGWVMARQGEFKDGIALMEDAAEQEPDDVTIQYHLAVAKLESGEVDAARPHLMAALSGPNYAHNIADARSRLVSTFPASSVIAPVVLIDGKGVHDRVGEVTLTQLDDELQFEFSATGLPAGHNAVHVHDYPVCGPSEDGVPGGLAGGHFGHGDHHADMNMEDADGSEMKMDHSAKMAKKGDGDMKMAMDMKPRGDLPPVMFNDQGVTNMVVKVGNLSLDEIRGRAIMIHEGPDVDGKSGVKLACAIIP